MKLIKAVIGILLIVFIFALLIGTLTPQNYQGDMAKDLNFSKEKVFAEISDMQSLQDKHIFISKMEKLPDSIEGNERWKAFAYFNQYLIFEVLQKVENEKFVLKISESSFGFTGTWTYELEDLGDLTTLKISENSDMKNFLLRSVKRVLGMDIILRQEFKILEKTLEKDK